jgi:hypothetical protein
MNAALIAPLGAAAALRLPFAAAGAFQLLTGFGAWYVVARGAGAAAAATTTTAGPADCDEAGPA